MITILSKLFIKDNKDDITERASYGILCGLLGIFLNIVLFSTKIMAGLLSGSVAIVADAFNNMSDAVSSIVSMLGFKLSKQKADSEHPYGHGRMEYVAGLIVSLLIILTSVELLESAIQKFISPTPIESSGLVLAILLFSIIIKLYMMIYNRKIGEKISSETMLAAATDSISDVISTSTVFICTLASNYTNINLDAYCGVAVGFFVLYQGITSIKLTITPLLGSAPKQETLSQIDNIISNYPEILGIHDLTIHDYGPGHFIISLHAEVDANSNLIEIHNVIDSAEHELETELLCEAVIHIDPVIHDSETDLFRTILTNITEKMEGQVTFHDVHIIKSGEQKIVHFDILIPIDYKYKDEEVSEYLLKNIKKYIQAPITPVIKIDRDRSSIVSESHQTQ